MRISKIFTVWVVFASLITVSSSHAEDAQIRHYNLGVSDALAIEIRNVGQTEYEFNVRIPQNGLISVPLLGEIPVRGYTIQETEKLLESKFRDGYLKQPEVTIRVSEYRPFFVDGAVEAPGAYPFQHGLTVEKAIVLAGGYSSEADQSDITISPENRPGTESEATQSTLVGPGDVVTVNKVFDSGVDHIYLYGAVNTPGVITYRTGLTVEKAIVLAGGFSPRASKRKIKIRRGSGDSLEEIKRAALSAAVEPGDIITIGESLF